MESIMLWVQSAWDWILYIGELILIYGLIILSVVGFFYRVGKITGSNKSSGDKTTKRKWPTPKFPNIYIPVSMLPYDEGHNLYDYVWQELVKAGKVDLYNEFVKEASEDSDEYKTVLRWFNVR